MLALDYQDKIIVTALCGVIVLVFAYTKYLETQQDITDVALNNQTSITGTRKPKETAYYRHNLVPHGFPLLHGLAIKHGYKLRDGNVRDIWSLAMKHQETKEIKFYNGIGNLKFSATYHELNGIFKMTYKKLVSEFTNDGGDGSINLKIGTVLPSYSWYGFVIAMTCFINNLTLHTFHSHILKYNTGDLDVLIVTKKDLRIAVHYYRTVKLIIVITSDKDLDDEYSMEDYQIAVMPTKLINWDDFFFDYNQKNDYLINKFKDDEYQYKYDPKYDDFIPLKETFNFNTITYTNQNLVSSVAHELKQLPMGHEWNKKDEILIFNNDSNIVIWNKVLSGLLIGCNVHIIEPLKLHEIKSVELEDLERQTQRENQIIEKRFFKTLAKLNEEQFFKNSKVIAIIPEPYLKILSNLESENFHSNSMIRKLLIGRSQMLLSQYNFNRLAPHPSGVFDKFRLIYSYTFKNVKSESVTSWEYSMLRTITGSRIIYERYLPGSIGPLFVTQLYDYRTVDEDNEEIKKDLQVLRGVPSQAIETKLVDYELLDEKYIADENQGELCIRGFIIGKSVDPEIVEQKIKEIEKVGGEGWMPTGLIGKFGDDGCFYEKVYSLF